MKAFSTWSIEKFYLRINNQKLIQGNKGVSAIKRTVQEYQQQGLRQTRYRLEAIGMDRSASDKRAWSGNNILATTDDCGAVETTRRLGKSKPVV